MYLFIFVAACIALYFIVMSQEVFGGTPSGKRLEKMKKSPNFRDGKFWNQHETPQFAEGYSMPKVMFDFFFSKKDPHLKPHHPVISVKTDLKNLPEIQDVFIWLGHSSYYIKSDGVSFLIDPVLSTYGSPFKFFNKAFSGADLFKPEDIPAIDYLVITHDHYDHLDFPTVKALKNRVGKVILPLGVGAHLEKWGYREDQLIEEDWGAEVALKNGSKITYTPARHFSGRKLHRNNTLWTSYVLETPRHKIFLGGDSGYDTHFKEIGEKFGPFDFAVLENGQYNPAWRYIHALPEDVIKASEDIGAKYIFPVHSGKFALALHPWNEPLEMVSKLGKEKNLQILTPKIGEPVDLNIQKYHFGNWWQEA